MRTAYMPPIPPITKNILIINTGIYLLMWFLRLRGIELTNILGLHYISSPYFKPFQIFTYQFVHGSFFHLLFNMFGLYIFGSRLEQVWGEKRYLLFYLFCVAGSAIFLFATDAISIYRLTGSLNPLNYSEVLPENVIEIYLKVTIGASGAIMGLLAAFAMLFPNTEMFIMFIPFPVKAKYLAIGYGLIELYQGIANRGGDNVAHFAHVGGLLFGFLLVLYWNKTNKKTFY